MADLLKLEIDYYTGNAVWPGSKLELIPAEFLVQFEAPVTALEVSRYLRTKTLLNLYTITKTQLEQWIAQFDFIAATNDVVADYWNDPNKLVSGVFVGKYQNEGIWFDIKEDGLQGLLYVKPFRTSKHVSVKVRMERVIVETFAKQP